MPKTLVFHRNLTHSYQHARHKEKEKAHRFDIKKDDSSSDPNEPSSNGNGTQSTNHVTMEILPEWLELVDECNYLLSNARVKVKELEKLQNMNLLNVFGKGGRGDYEKISNLSVEITTTFKKIEINTEKISKEVDNYIEHQLRNNAKAKIATDLVPLSISFRKMQKKFYDSLQNDSINNDMTIMNNVVRDEIIQDSVQTSHENIADRTMVKLKLLYLFSKPIFQNSLLFLKLRLQQIAVTVQDLKDMYTQMSTMLVEQGSMLDQIDYNVREFSRNSHKFAQALKLRHERDNPRKAIKTVRYLVTFIFVQVPSLFQYIYNNNI
ncbi:syntaxin, putative [Theileria annulata]|uniref:Syntaxin, putative n=1 Tax=Theileria annulata TaxID=5874 RepID=Q4U9S7_THEAN|nr:syntaxin, putative [Theileria annulata]CAI76426.1 syntaxin, putative [Theileria annulata]|eukprot:XP_953051.1 syntaxin, putative [Theileria annulata]